MIAIIAAVSINNVIGKNGGIPWRIPEDLKRFKALTMGHRVIMGRKTFESLLSKRLPGREIIILSKTLQGVPGGAIAVCPTFTGALSLCQGMDVFIAGGAEVYREAFQYADTLYITKVYQEYEGDTFFPYISAEDWNVTEVEKHIDSEVPYSFLTLSR